MLDKRWVFLYAVSMENEEEQIVNVNVHWLDSLGYLAEMRLENGKAYRKEYVKEGNEWRELGPVGWQREYNFLSSAQMAAIGTTATEFCDGDYESRQHKYISGDRLDLLTQEAVKLQNAANESFGRAVTADGLVEARIKHARAQGMLDMLRFVRGHQEGE